MKRIICSSVAAVLLTGCLLTGCGSASSSIASSAASSAASASTSASASSVSSSSASSTPASSSESSSISSSSSIPSSSSQPEPVKPSYSKVEVIGCSFDKITYNTVSKVTITINGYSHVQQTVTPHYEIAVKVNLKNSGNLDRSIDSSNFAVTWDGNMYDIDEFHRLGSFDTTLEAGESATYTLEIPITEEQYNDWASQHIVTLTSMFTEKDSANDTYTVYQYLTSTGAVSLKK